MTASETGQPRRPRLESHRFAADPFRTLTEIRDTSAAVPVEAGGFRMWLVTRYEDARRILADPDMRRDLVQNRGSARPG